MAAIVSVCIINTNGILVTIVLTASRETQADVPSNARCRSVIQETTLANRSVRRLQPAPDLSCYTALDEIVKTAEERTKNHMQQKATGKYSK